MRRWLFLGALGASCTPAPRELPTPKIEIQAGCAGAGCDELEVEIASDTPRRSDGADMAFVPAGGFTMGCDAGEWECDTDEQPAHHVVVHAFVIDRVEVTVEAYTECVQAGRCEPPAGRGANCNWDEPGHVRHPINCVSWTEAEAFCRWKGKRLPTEAEWEKASRGSEGLLFPWGAETADCQRAVLSENGLGCGANSTAEVGSKPDGASPYGVLDLAGNVWEWVYDWYQPTFAGNPPSDPTGPPVGSERVIKGGSWDDTWAARAARGACRSSNPPDSFGGQTGFRCANDD